jgi:hypothetical protein
MTICEESADDRAVFRSASRGNAASVPFHRKRTEGGEMGFDQYHEPAEELSAETRTFARMIASLTEEAEAIGWYEQRMSLEPDAQAKAIMENAQGEEFKHFGMDLEFLLRRTPKWRIALREVLFTEGDIVELGEAAEDAENR